MDNIDIFINEKKVANLTPKELVTLLRLANHPAKGDKIVIVLWTEDNCVCSSAFERVE